MTPEKLDEARAREAWRIYDGGGVYKDSHTLSTIAARLAREGWMPPPPVDPDLLAFREFASKAARSASLAESYRDGDMDSCASAYLFLAGARMAREQERERAKPLVERFSALVERVYDDARRRKRTGVNASEMISARAALAAYKAGKEAGK